jgi:hypothetical protein
MPRIHMPDGSVLEAPYGLGPDELRSWVKDEMAKKGAPRPESYPHPGIGSLPFPRNTGEVKQYGDINREQSAAMIGGAAIGPGGVLKSAGTVGRVLSHPVTVGAITTGTRMAGGTPPARAVGEGVLASLFAGPRIARAGRKFDELMKSSAARFGRGAKVAEEGVEEAMAIPGRTLTKPSAPPFLPKGKMRLDLGPTEQTTLTGTAPTSRPLTPKPQFSSTGAAPKGKVSQPNVTVRAGSMDPAKQGAPFASGPVTPRSTPAGGGGAGGSEAPDFDALTKRVSDMVRDTGASKADITKMLAGELGATPDQARTLVEAIFARGGLTRR